MRLPELCFEMPTVAGPDGWGEMKLIVRHAEGAVAYVVWSSAESAALRPAGEGAGVVVVSVPPSGELSLPIKVEPGNVVEARLLPTPDAIGRRSGEVLATTPAVSMKPARPKASAAAQVAGFTGGEPSTQGKMLAAMKAAERELVNEARECNFGEDWINGDSIIGGLREAIAAAEADPWALSAADAVSIPISEEGILGDVRAALLRELERQQREGVETSATDVEDGRPYRTNPHVSPQRTGEFAPLVRVDGYVDLGALARAALAAAKPIGLDTVVLVARDTAAAATERAALAVERMALDRGSPPALGWAEGDAPTPLPDDVKAQAAAAIRALLGDTLGCVWRDDPEPGE